MRKAQARVKRRGKSSPLAQKCARHEKPHAVQDKTEEGQPVRLILGYRSHYGPAKAGPDIRPACGTDEMNDHPQHFASKVLGQNSAYRHRNYEGRFRKRRRPSLFQATDGLSSDCLRRSGSTFSTSASAVMPCFFRRIGTAPCSMN